MSVVLTQIHGSSSLDRVQIVTDSEETTNSSFVQIVVVLEAQEEAPAASVNGADYPVLAAIWNNESDAAYDSL